MPSRYIRYCVGYTCTAESVYGASGLANGFRIQIAQRKADWIKHAVPVRQDNGKRHYPDHAMHSFRHIRFYAKKQQEYRRNTEPIREMFYG